MRFLKRWFKWWRYPNGDAKDSFLLSNQSNVVYMTKVSDSLMEGSTTIILSQPVYSSVLPPYNFFMAVYFDVSLDHKILCEWLHLMYGIKMVCGLEE